MLAEMLHPLPQLVLEKFIRRKYKKFWMQLSPDHSNNMAEDCLPKYISHYSSNPLQLL
jgi:hypothetical protein